MYSCQECIERLYPFLDRDLNSEEQREVRQHLSLCSHCRTRFRFENNVLHFVSEIARATSCPEEARARILRACGHGIAS